MCCETHDLRDFLTRRHGGDQALAAVLAPDDMHRCRCTELGKWQGQQCRRAATGEDVLCDWCRETDHMSFYDAALHGGDPAVAAYYADRAGPGYAVAYPAGEPRPYGAELPWDDPAADVAGDVRREMQKLADAGRAWRAEYYPRADSEGPVRPLTGLRFTSDAIEGMRALSGWQDLPPAEMTFELPPVSTEATMRYLMRKYGSAGSWDEG